MKYSLVAVALATAVSAQSLSDVPKCAIPCLDDAISSETSCETTDLTCVCKEFDAVRSAATSCVIEKCGADTALNEVLPATEKLCENPESGSSSSAAESSAAETSAAETSAAETSAAETSAAATSTVEATSAVLTTETAVSTISTASFTDVVIAPTPVTPTGSNDTTAAPTSGATGGATGGAGTSASAVPTGGAAALGSMGGLAMVILGALAL